MTSLAFACMAYPERTEHQALLLARSIRTFGGMCAADPIYVVVPAGEQALAPTTAAELASLEVRLIPATIDRAVLAFPFGGKVLAAAAAEQRIAGSTELLAWMDADSLLLNQPDSLALPSTAALGYRPVDHTLIGSRFDRPIDPFWALIFRDCQVPDAHLFPMTTSVDEVVLRPYFNAGLLLVRPERGLLGRWADNLLRLFQAPHYEPFFEKSALYRIFIHQAILAGTVLAALAPDESVQLPHTVSYPLHMHQDYPPGRRPATVNELTTCRYDLLAGEQDWQSLLPVEEPLRSWLQRNLGP